MNSHTDRQARYWDRQSRSFDTIYSHRKGPLENWLDRTFRRDMYDRFRFALDQAGPVAGRSVLDLGCGSGRYCLAFAQAGAGRVVGVDIAPRMLELARELTASEGQSGRCEFRHSEVLGLDRSERFDIVLAIGLFDYLPDPLPALEVIRAVTADRVILSFPRRYTWRAPLRKLRLALRGCPVYFYTHRAIDDLVRRAGFPRFERQRVGKLECVVACAA